MSVDVGGGQAGAFGGVVLMFRGAPVPVSVLHRRQAIQAYVLRQEGGGHRMAVAGGHVGAPAVPHQAGQPQPAADFQHPLGGVHRPQRHARCQVRAGRPQQPEQRPHGGRNAHAFGLAEGIGVLLFVQQGANDQVGNARYGDALLLGLVAGHRGGSHNGGSQ